MLGLCVCIPSDKHIPPTEVCSRLEYEWRLIWWPTFSYVEGSTSFMEIGGNIFRSVLLSRLKIRVVFLKGVLVPAFFNISSPSGHLAYGRLNIRSCTLKSHFPQSSWHNGSFQKNPIHLWGRRFVPYIAQLLVLIKHYMSDLLNHYL